MILKHAWGLMVHPKKEWEIIKNEKCTVGHCYIAYLLIMAAIPTLSIYYGVTETGWQVGAGEIVKLTKESAMNSMAGLYVAILVSIFFMGRMICWLAKSFGAKSTPTKSIVVASYIATPLFLSGIIGLYPILWIDMLVGLIAVGYTIYLLYTGLPVIMEINEDQGFLLSSSVLTVALVTLISIVVATIIIWSFGLQPAYV